MISYSTALFALIFVAPELFVGSYQKLDGDETCPAQLEVRMHHGELEAYLPAKLAEIDALEAEDSDARHAHRVTGAWTRFTRLNQVEATFTRRDRFGNMRVREESRSELLDGEKPSIWARAESTDSDVQWYEGPQVIDTQLRLTIDSENTIAYHFSLGEFSRGIPGSGIYLEVSCRFQR